MGSSGFRSLGHLLAWALLFSTAEARAQEAGPPPRVAFIGLHGGVFEPLEGFAGGLGLKAEYVPDEQISAKTCDLSVYRLVFIQHVREEDSDSYRELFLAAKKKGGTRFFAVGREGAGAVAIFKDLGADNPVETDAEISKYLPRSRENLRRFLIYIGVKYLGKGGEILPPADADATANGPYHPDHDGRFATVPAFLEWAASKGKDPAKLPRAAVVAHAAHLEYQQPRVVEALVRALEAKGVLAAGFTDGANQGAKHIEAFKPDVVIHTCHSGETVESRVALDAPHLHSLFFRKHSIDHWQNQLGGFTQGEAAFQVIGQEFLGAIEPQVGAGTLRGGGGPETFTPIEERIDHLTARALSWITLRRTSHADKKIAILYYDREAGQNELMRGSATGMHLHAPRSLVKVLQKMKGEGYSLSSVPQNEDELVSWLIERGRQYGLWNQAELDRLARSGHAVLLPVETYREWFAKEVPPAVQDEVAKHWGPAPGKGMVYTGEDGKQSIVIPRIDLGNVVLMPQPLRGEGQDPSLLHSGLTPPPHNYLATYFWLRRAFGAHAMVHFGTHGSEFFLPSNPVGQNDRDWTDILMGETPNINPWIIDNVGEVAPVKRRVYGLTLGFLTPPIVTAGLSDDLLNLRSLIDKWDGLDDGALREGFRRQITNDVARLNLAKEVGLKGVPKSPLEPDQIRKVVEYLHDIEGETTPVSLHVLGEPPREDLMVPFLTTILKRKFLDALGRVIPIPASETRLPGRRETFLRRKAEEAVELVVRRGISPADAVIAIGGRPGAAPSPDVTKGLELALDLSRRFARTTDEIDNILKAFDGHFIPPGPVNSPIRNPGAVPTGRNLYMLNPEEIPTRPSWDLAKTLIDELLERTYKEKGHYPEKMAFDLRPHATFRDYGVMEAQILHCLGVEPVYDDRDLVNDVKLIPAEVLKRPRIDVFIAPGGLYTLNLPGRLELIDKAVRLVAGLKERDNAVLAHSERVFAELQAKGLPADRAKALSVARIFGVQPGEYSSPGNGAFIRQSGSWTTRDEVIAHYLSKAKNVYTKDHWGEPAPEAYDRQIQGTDTVLRSWSDHMTGPLANEYMWLHGGQLALAIEHMTGKAPEYLLSDVRDFDKAGVVRAEDALAKEFRVRLFNRKWIEGMMKEGYSGADQIAVMVGNTMGWEVVRQGSIPQETWAEIESIFVRDKLDLSIREWFETQNPFAFQEVGSLLLESIRKGYWKADAETTRRIAEAYARSVVRHGDNGGLRSGGNIPLRQYVERALKNAGNNDLAELSERYLARFAPPATTTSATAVALGPAPGPGPGPAPTVAPSGGPASARPGQTAEAPKPAPGPSETVEAKTLVKAPPTGPAPEPASTSTSPSSAGPPAVVAWILAVSAMVLVLGGFFWRRRGA